jgi:glucan endo-1,3-alpha-glucosidase
MPCAGNPFEKCGNGWRVSLYRFNGTSSDTSSTASASATATATGSIGLNGTATATATGTGALNGTATASVTGALNSTATGTATGTLSAVLPANTTSPVTTTPAPTGELEWMSIGCAVDMFVDARVLPGIHFYGQKDLTVDKCIVMCEDAGYTFAGVEWGEECYCGNNTLSSVQYVDDSECSMPCAGDSSETCGENFRMEIFQLTTAEECEGEDDGQVGVTSTKAALPTGNMLVTGGNTTAVAASSTTAVAVSSTAIAASSTAAIAAPSSFVTSVRSSVKPSKTSVAVVPTTKTKPSAASGPKPTGLVERVSTDIPSSNRAHEVYAHHMVGNTYPYGKADWAKDIANAKAAGIDGFALNMGSDWWQAARVADAYAAATEAGGFTMFLSLDMTAMGCGSVTDAATLVALVTTFGRSSAQTKHNGKVLVSTFSGENCNFGQGSTSDGWNVMFKQPLKLVGTDIFFVPSVFSDPSTFASASWMDGELNWNSGWPMSASPLDTSSDERYAAALGSKEYMPAISPFFFTHFPTWGWNKNWIYRSDDFLYARRWEQVIAMRDTVKFTEILTWNDYGESSYISPTVGALPSGSEVWVDGFPHDALLDVTQYYAAAFKTGVYPAVTQDKVIWWARPHPKAATATSDYMPRPSRWEETEDNVYALVFSTGDGVVTMTSGSNKETYAVSAGLNKIKLGMSAGSVTIKLTRNGSNVFSYDSTGEFTYTNSPTTYNFNLFVGHSV